MIGRVCLTGFVSIMALGASCEDTRSFNFSTMKFDFVVMAKCLDPRNVDLKKGFDETCANIGKVFDFNSSFYRSSKPKRHASPSPISSSYAYYAQPTYNSYAAAPPAYYAQASCSQSAPTCGAKVVRVR